MKNAQKNAQKNTIYKDNGGFTLLELIIVMAVIAILAGLFSSMYMKYIEKSKIARQEDLAKRLYDAAGIAVLELMSNESQLGCNYANVTAQYHDPVTGRTCGMITTDILGPVSAGSMSASVSEKTRIASYIIETTGTSVNYSNVNPAGAQCNFSDDQVRIMIVLDDEGVFRLEYGYDKYLTTVTGSDVVTQKYTSGNIVNFSNPS